MTTPEQPDFPLSDGDSGNSNPPVLAYGPATHGPVRTSHSLFQRIVAIVLALHIATLCAIYYFAKQHPSLPPEVRIPIAPPLIPQEVAKPLPAPPLGMLTTVKPAQVRHAPNPQPNAPAPSHAIATKVAPNETGDIAPSEPSAPPLGPSSDIDTNDVKQFAGNMAEPGVPTTGSVPAGFPNGRIDGRVYFIRLKHDIGNWYAHTEGVAALLEFMNRSFRCESEDRPMTAAEIQTNYIAKSAIPSFIYISCDGNFSLTDREASILRGYIDSGGFLFLDSAPDDLTRDVVSSQLARVVPGAPMEPIPPSHPINRFLYRLAQPGVGENWSDARNYGISKNGRLVVFYSPGNLAHYYELAQGKNDDYSTAQFQMGANVVAYAVNKGVQAAVQQRPGARGTITRATLQDLGFLDRAAPSTTAKKHGPPPKIVPGKTPAQDVPADVKLVD